MVNLGFLGYHACTELYHTRVCGASFCKSVVLTSPRLDFPARLGMCCNVGNFTLDFRETFPDLPYKEINRRQIRNMRGEYLRAGAVIRWRQSFIDVLSDWQFPSSENPADIQSASPSTNEATGNSAQMRDNEYRSVIKEYLLNRVAAPDKFQYIGLRELVHDPQLAAYRTKLVSVDESAPHRFRKHLFGRILDETSSNHGSALSELFLCRLFSPMHAYGSENGSHILNSLAHCGKIRTLLHRFQRARMLPIRLS